MRKQSAEQIRIWAEKIAESNREAFDSLFRSLYPRLVRFSFGYVGSKAAAGDIVQDAFIILWEKRRELDPQSSVKGYLYRIVRNRSLNYLRDYSGKTVGLELLSGSQLQAVSDPGTETEEESEQLLDMLKEWIEELPNRQREAFELSRFEGLDHGEIAGVMEISPNTVNNHLVAALDYLRTRYDGYLNEMNGEKE